jgi:hypothetical protein
MDPRKPPMSGSSEPLDALITRMLCRQPFDLALVAWDLFPAWNPEGNYCRWQETLDLYRFLAASRELPQIWKEQAVRRYESLARRSSPRQRQSPPPLEPGMVLPVCMEPMFESLLVQDEAAVKRALGIQGRIQGWPSQGWGKGALRPDEKVLAPAIQALRRIRPKRPVVAKVRGDMETNKDGWGEYILRQMLADNEARQSVLGHPLSKRLQELIQRDRI